LASVVTTPVAPHQRGPHRSQSSAAGSNQMLSRARSLGQAAASKGATLSPKGVSDQLARRQRNPDASLYCGAPDIDGRARHGPSAPRSCSGSGRQRL